MKQFIFEHWKEIVEITLSLCCLVILLIKRRKINPSISGVSSQLPDLVGIAEQKFGKGCGASKKQFVLDCACRLYEKSTGVKLTEKSGIYHIFDDTIETILSTPQKKEKK